MKRRRKKLLRFREIKKIREENTSSELEKEYDEIKHKLGEWTSVIASNVNENNRG